MPGGELTVDVRPNWSISVEGPAEEAFAGRLTDEFEATYVRAHNETTEVGA